MERAQARPVTWCSGIALAAALTGCNSFDAPGPDPNTPVLMIPVDSRAAEASPARVPAVSGGTLLATADGRYVLASDPARDRVSVVDVNAMSIVGTVALQPGDEPGRLVEAEQRVHVALRRGGALVSIDPVTATIVDRRAVCKSPRGVAFDPSTALLHVACAEGKLVSLPASGGAAVRTLALEPDLRDVLVRGSELWVTRFKSAQVMRIGNDGSLLQRTVIPNMAGVLEHGFDATKPEQGSRPPDDVTLAASVAWRAAPLSGGAAVVVHQQNVLDDVEITPPSTGGSAYGGGNGFGSGCGGIVRDAISVIAPDGTTRTTPFTGAPLPVDIAVSPDQQWTAIAHAGPADPLAPRPSLITPGESGGASAPRAADGFASGVFGSLTLLSAANDQGESSCRFNEAAGLVTDPISAVTFTPSGRLVAQSLQPPRLTFIDVPFNGQQSLDLPGDARLDTGAELFHRDAGGGIACASCHPEGAEDGNTWHFLGTGARRTQALHVGLRDTAPFHWAGDLPGVADVMKEVFVGRMGGVRQSADRLSSLSEWLFSIPSPPAVRDADESAARGKALFESANVGCTTCHSGAKLTDNLSVVVDSHAALKMQVPSLIGIAYRAPFMHTGCAATLAARFDPACGGDLHGNTANLTQAEVGDIIAYLETL